MDEFSSQAQHHDEPTFGSYDPQNTGGNVLGIVGFVLSLTCILSPVGLLMCLFALTKPKKGFALAGTVTGSILTLFVAYLTYSAILFVSNPHLRAQGETVLEFAVIKAAIVESNGVPTSLSDPAIQLPEFAMNDYWNTPYVYTEDGTGAWSITTLGPDKAPGGGDDVTLTHDMDERQVVKEIDVSLMTWKSMMRQAPEQVQSVPDQPAPEPPADELDTSEQEPPTPS